MNRPTQGRPVQAMFWKLYLVLGLISVGVGALLFGAPHLFVHTPGLELGLTRMIGAIFLVFGVVRIGNAVINLRRPGNRLR